MATIKKKVENLRDAIQREKTTPTPGSTLIRDVRTAAVKATLGGKISDEWANFMAAIFADNPAQLNRLLAKDTHAALSYFDETSAYLVGGSICTSETMAHLPSRIDPQIDAGLDDKTDNSEEFKAVKGKLPIEIPKPA